MARAIGIDLGTTYSAVAAVNELGQPEILNNRDSGRITPSVVMFQGGEVVVGEEARRSLTTDSDKVVQFVKRQMGNPSWCFEVDGHDAYTPEHISALILRRLTEDAVMAMDEAVGEVVITVPAYFDDVKRMATKQAGEIAGLKVGRVINEPTAAAIAYGLQANEDGTILVYDLGGGTFDVTILEVVGHEFVVKATIGDPNLGGFDWDGRLVQHISAELLKVGGPDSAQDMRLQADLRDRAESLKRNLSLRESGKVHVTAGGVTLRLEVTRGDFERMTHDLLQRTESLLEMVLVEAELTYADIDKVLLVGGSTRMPMVRRLVKELCGKEPEKGVNPDEVVALGAAIIASTLEPSPSIPVVVKDVTAHSLGVIAVDRDTHEDINVIIMPRNTAVPDGKASVVNTIVDDQTEIEVLVTEGEDRDPRYVNIIGKATIRIPPYPRGAPVRIRMGYDIDGLITVTVTDLTANAVLSGFEIERDGNMSDDEVHQRRSSMEQEVII